MTRRALTSIGSATAVATAVGACLLLGPSPQAQASTICNSSGSCVTFGTGSISATSNGNTASVNFITRMACAIPAVGMQQCSKF